MTPHHLAVLALSSWPLVSYAVSFPDMLNDPDIKQLRRCALAGLDLSVGSECPTDSCVCQSEDLQSMLGVVSRAVDIQCSTNIYDATAVMFSVISYCSIHGYTVPPELTSIIPPPGKFYVVLTLFTNIDFYTLMIGNNQPLSVCETPEVTELPNCARIPFIRGSDSLDCHTNACFCRPDLMVSAMGGVSSRVNAACSGIAPAGVNSAIAIITNYCTRSGFVASPFDDEATGTASVPSSTSASPGAVIQAFVNCLLIFFLGACSSLVQPTSPTPSMGSPGSIPPCHRPPPSNHISIILPATIIPAALVFTGAIWLLLRRWRRTVPHEDPQIGSIENPNRNPASIFANSQHAVISNCLFQIVGGNQQNIRSNQSDSSSARR
jgi:hypothetical protein